MKKLFLCALLIATLFTAAVCSASTYTNAGMNLTIPDEYEDILVIEVPENDPNGLLFSVSEKASIETAAAQSQTFSGAGWLFGISRVDEDLMHDILCWDIPGADIFAKDEAGFYYIYRQPTDVRVVREDYNDPAVWEEWGKLTAWARSMQDQFLSENAGLTPEKFGHTMIDIYLARVLYLDGAKYTVSSTEFGPVGSDRADPAVYLLPLIENVTYEEVPIEETPDGEYIVLNFPDDDIRFDFFLMEGKENYVRQSWFRGEYVELYKADFSDPEIKASLIMQDFYRDTVLAESLGYSPADMVGVWADKIAGRCAIEIREGDNGTYHVDIRWGNSAFESYLWTMDAVPTGNGAELRYENAKHTILTFFSDTESTETVVYENGTGSFDLLSTYEVMWNDETEHAADGMLLIKAGD